MAQYYWFDVSSGVSKCPNDYHQLREINYQQAGMPSCTGYECPFCNGIFIPYVDAETAARQLKIGTNCLSTKERQKIQMLRKAKSIEEKRQRDEQRKAEQKKQQREKEAERLRNHELMKKKRAEQEAHKARKDELIAQIQSVFESDYLSVDSFYENNNEDQLLFPEEFQELKRDFVKQWFSYASQPPDEDQRAAIAATEKNIEVVARAGSGKTTTIVNRYRFLTEHCRVDPSSVLLLAFNRIAATKLHDDISKLFETYNEKTAKMPHVMTFHALAYSIVHPTETLIYDDEKAGSMILSRAVQSVIDEKLRDISWASKIRIVMLSHFKGNWEEIEKSGHNLSKEKQIAYRRSLPNRALDGRYVKSYGEKVIANILFEHEIDYTYEKAFRWFDGSPYRPDFTVSLPDNKQIIIEYFGLAGDIEYDQQIQKKEAYWENKAPLIKLYRDDVNAGEEILTQKLLGELKKNGVEFRHLSEEEIWEKIKDRALDEFTATITSFIGRCRKKDLSSQGLRDLVQGYQSDLLTESLFLEIACEIYDDYLQKINREKLEDFDGLLSRAIKLVNEGRTGFDKQDNRGDLQNLSHIMIDEYQDFSLLFEAFLAAIRRTCPQANIFCVGDDWQAINAFAGSDVYYFNEFSNRYTDAKRYYLKTNYRSKQEIVTAGVNLMSHGDDTVNIKPSNQGKGLVRIGYYSDFYPIPEERKIHGTDYLTPAILRLINSALGKGKKVTLLMRANDRLPLPFSGNGESAGTIQERFINSIRSYYSPEQRKNIGVSTTHKYKGDEEDVIIILDAAISYYPLIHPSWIFQRVFGDTIEKLIDDEERLFYVAVSRAKEELYILTTKGEESPFLSSLGNITRLRWDDYVNGQRIEVRNQPPWDSSPTRAIKDILKNEYQYQWDPQRKAWYHYYPREDFDIQTVFAQSWIKTANSVVLLQCDENDQPEFAFLINNGNIMQVPIRKN